MELVCVSHFLSRFIVQGVSIKVCFSTQTPTGVFLKKNTSSPLIKSSSEVSFWKIFLTPLILYNMHIINQTVLYVCSPWVFADLPQIRWPLIVNMALNILARDSALQCFTDRL